MARAAASRSSCSTASAGSWPSTTRPTSALGDAAPGRRLGEEQAAAHPDLLVLFLESPPELPAYQELRAGLHRGRLARAAHAARAAAGAARERDAARLRRRRADGAGAAGGRAGARADRRRALPRRARDGPRGRRARPHAGEADRGGDRRLVRRAREPRGDHARGRGPTAASSCRCGRGCCASCVENLLANAIRYAGPGKHVHGRAARIRPRGRVLTVSDDGKGVDAADLPRLFERFYRGDQARTSRGTGPRPRDREARRHVSRRRGGGDERARPRPRDPRPVSPQLSDQVTVCYLLGQWRERTSPTRCHRPFHRD